jgi:hypothetical protein
VLPGVDLLVGAQLAPAAAEAHASQRIARDPEGLQRLLK